MLLAGSSRAAGVARVVPLLYRAPRGDTVVCTDTLSPSSHIIHATPTSRYCARGPYNMLPGLYIMWLEGDNMECQFS